MNRRHMRFDGTHENEENKIESGKGSFFEVERTFYQDNIPCNDDESPLLRGLLWDNKRLVGGDSLSLSSLSS